MPWLVLLLVLSSGHQPAVAVVPFLSDADCKGTVVIVDLGAQVFASCSSDESQRVLNIEVVNRPVDKGPLRQFSVGFCGDVVVSAEAPLGWQTTVTKASDRTTVEWNMPGWPPEAVGLAPGGHLSGFTVRLRPGWRRSGDADMLWPDWAQSQGTTHDCLDLRAK
jgi:hypothetical protein